eukprot:9157409-Lingulodinium_polyedra.AAC.1
MAQDPPAVQTAVATAAATAPIAGGVARPAKHQLDGQCAFKTAKTEGVPTAGMPRQLRAPAALSPPILP